MGIEPAEHASCRRGFLGWSSHAGIGPPLPESTAVLNFRPNRIRGEGIWASRVDRPLQSEASRMMWLEDFAPGQTYRSRTLRVEADQIKTFAAQFDPQPFHLDEAAARDSFFGGLAASGWHTAALTMRLLVGSDFQPAGGIIGSRADELKWPRAVRPGDELRVEAEVLEVQASESRPGHGFVKCRTTTLNQKGKPVQVLVMNLLVRRKSA